MSANPAHHSYSARSIQLDLQLCREKDEKERGEEVLHEEEEEEAVMVVTVTQRVTLTGSAVEVVHQPVVGRRRKV